jgi:hypothetical protein
MFVELQRGRAQRPQLSHESTLLSRPPARFLKPRQGWRKNEMKTENSIENAKYKGNIAGRRLNMPQTEYNAQILALLELLGHAHGLPPMSTRAA